MSYNNSTNIIQVSPPNEALGYRVPAVPKSEPGNLVNAVRTYIPAPIADVAQFGYRRSNSSVPAVIADFMRGEVQKIPRPVLGSRVHECYQYALRITSRMFAPPQRYRPIHYCDVRYYPWHLSASAEEPFRTNPKYISLVNKAFAEGKISDNRMSKSNLFNVAFVTNRQIIHQIKFGDLRCGKTRCSPPILAHARSHVVAIDDPDKIRMVFGVPWLILMVECMLLWPLQNYYRSGSTPLAWGYETMNGGLQRLLTEMPALHSVCSLDWHAFDKHIPYFLISDIHAEMERWIDFDSGYLPTMEYTHSTSPTHPIKIKRLWDFMTQIVKDAPIRLPDGSLYKKKHAGLCSGLFQTQILGSFCNATIILTVLSVMGIDISRYYVKVLGDDSVFPLPLNVDGPAFLNTFANHAKLLFGMQVNTVKTRIARSPSFLRFLGFTSYYGTPTRDVTEVLAKFMKPERRWDSSKLKGRALGLAYSSNGTDYRLYQIAKHVYDELKEFPLDISGSRKLTFFASELNMEVNDEFPPIEDLIKKLSRPYIPLKNTWPGNFLCEF